MYFNIPEELIEKYENSYPDLLSEVHEVYEEFEENFKDEDDLVLLYFNEHLKIFPIINSWKNEIFYQWDICRRSLICATSLVKEFCVNFKDDDISNERINIELLTEYYLDNISFRVFSILDKIGHPLNLILSLGLKDREVSYHNIKGKILGKDDWPVFQNLFLDFEKEDNLLAEFKEYRNSLTHRKHLLQPKFELEDIELDLGENNENGLNGKLIANTVKQVDSEIDIVELHAIVEKIYNRLIDFLERIFFFMLDQIIKRYKKEQDECI